MGDFNLYHLIWDIAGRISIKASVLTELAQQWSLDLVTFWGTVTRICEGQRNSTLDLIWASEGLRIQYGGELDYFGSNHRV